MKTLLIAPVIALIVCTSFCSAESAGSCYAKKDSAQKACPGERVVWGAYIRALLYFCEAPAGMNENGCWMCERVAQAQGLKPAQHGNCGVPSRR